jgi:hypothetical protein
MFLVGWKSTTNEGPKTREYTPLARGSPNALCKMDKTLFLVGCKNLKLDFKPFSLGNVF